jgi:hypothetical protein
MIIKIKILVLLVMLTLSPLILNESKAQIDPESSFSTDSPFNRKFGDVKFLNAYFGVPDQKMEVSPGDNNVPFTIAFANVGTQDITGIRGQLSMPPGFSPTTGSGQLILADAGSNALAGDVFYLTFFVNVDKNTEIRQYPAAAKIDYSRLRESGIRNAFFDFDFKVTGKSVINMRALDPILNSLKKNHIIIEISNTGTAPVSGVDIVLKNTEGTISSTAQSVTNVENVVVLDSSWDVGHIDPKSVKYIEFEVYVPESLKGDTLRAPMDITYFNAHGDRHTISRIVDFYVKGLIDVSIYNVGIFDLSGKPTIIGEIINEGNEDALFGFVTVEPLGDSNIRKSTQFIDEIETDSPIPFNVPIEFEGKPRYGEHDIRIIVRYKDSLREENFVTYDTSILIPDPNTSKSSEFDPSALIAVGAVIGIGAVVFTQLKKKGKVPLSVNKN